MEIYGWLAEERNLPESGWSREERGKSNWFPS